MLGYGLSADMKFFCNGIGVIACEAIKTRMALRVGSAMAWNTSLLIVLIY
jgi:hypothetical protein